MYELFTQYVNGLITYGEFHEALHDIQIYGDVTKRDGKIRFVGYDYKNQNWIKIN